MRILIFTQGFPPLIGGAGMQARLLAEGMTELGHEVTVSTETPGADDPSWRFGVDRQFTPYSFFRLARRSEAVLVIGASLKAILPALAARRPVVVSHVMFPGTGTLEKLKIAACRLVTNVAVSTAVARALGVPSVVIPNPYDDRLFRTEPDRTRDKDLVFVGRIIPEKGLSVLVSALAALRQQGQHPSLTVIGDGPEISSIRNQVDREHLTEQVTFLGALPPAAIADELRRHRIIVIPSIWEEPFGIVALEGIGCGSLPIAAEVGGLPEAVGKCGLLYPKQDPAALADAINRSLQGAGASARIEKYATKHLERHRRANVARKYVSIIKNRRQTQYRRVISGSQSDETLG